MKNEFNNENNNNISVSIGSETNQTMPAKDVNDFRYHRLEKESQYNELQVINVLFLIN